MNTGTGRFVGNWLCAAVMFFPAALLFPAADALAQSFVGTYCWNMTVTDTTVTGRVVPFSYVMKTGITNMGNMLGGMIMPSIVGWMLDRRWDGTIVNGVRVYDLDAYRAGFGLMLLWLAAALVLLVFVRETHCQQTQ